MDLANKLKMDPKEFYHKYHPVWMAMYMVPWKKLLEQYPKMDLTLIKKGFIELGRFKEKWQVLVPTEPQEENAPDFFDAYGSHPSSGQPVEVLSPFSKKPIELNDQDPNPIDPFVWEKGFLDLRVNLQVSKNQILNRIGEILNIAQKMTAEEHFAEFKDPKWAKYEECLRIYDEVVEKGNSVEELTHQMDSDFKSKSKEEQGKIISRMEQLLSEGKRMVDLGISNND